MRVTVASIPWPGFLSDSHTKKECKSASRQKKKRHAVTLHGHPDELRTKDMCRILGISKATLYQLSGRAARPMSDLGPEIHRFVRFVELGAVGNVRLSSKLVGL